LGVSSETNPERVSVITARNRNFQKWIQMFKFIFLWNNTVSLTLLNDRSLSHRTFASRLLVNFVFIIIDYDISVILYALLK
jgi:hypothetical protein